MTMRSYALDGVRASVEAFNAVSGQKLRVEDSPFVGPRSAPLKTIDIGSEYPINSNQNVVGLELINGTFVGMHHYGPAGPCDSVHVRDVEFRNHKKWASRSYRMRGGNRIEFTAFRDVIDEHGIYWNLAGGNKKGEASFTLTSCYFENISSQAVQLVQRDHEQGFDFVADCVPGGPVFFSDSLLRNVGSGWGDLNRASYAISAFGRELQNIDGTATLSTASIEQAIYIRRVMIDNTMQVLPHKDGATSHGALYIGPRPKATVTGFVALMGKTDRPVARFEGIDDVHLDGCYLHAQGGQAWIEFENCRQITVTNCKGNVEIHLRTAQGSASVGTITQGFTQK